MIKSPQTTISPQNQSHHISSIQPSSHHQQQPADIMDPYSPMIVQDMLSGHNEWRSVQDIVKLTLKALCDVVKS